jgi:hypothetical protein
MLSDSEASPEKGKPGRECSTHLPGMGDASLSLSMTEKISMTEKKKCHAEPLAKHPRRGENRVEKSPPFCQDWGMLQTYGRLLRLPARRSSA